MRAGVVGLMGLVLGGCALTPRIETRGELRRVLENTPRTEHNTAYREKEVKHQGLDAVITLGRRQFDKISELVFELRCNEDFVSSIGRELEEDIEDEMAEHGGLVMYDKNDRLKILPLTSEVLAVEEIPSDLPDVTTPRLTPGANMRYVMPAAGYVIPHLFGYHMHAVSENDSWAAGPSYDVSSFFKNKIGGDIGSAYGQIKEDGASDQIVITKLKGRRFNVGYFGGQLDDSGEPVVSVLNLGDYDY